MEKMNELFESILTNSMINGSYQTMIGYWKDCGCENSIHYDIDSEFDEWYTYALLNFADWYSSCIYRDDIEIDDEMVNLTIQYENDTTGESCLNDRIDDETAYNKYIINILIIKYLNDDDHDIIFNNKFKNAMKEIYDYIKEEEEEEDEEEEDEDIPYTCIGRLSVH